MNDKEKTQSKIFRLKFSLSGASPTTLPTSNDSPFDAFSFTYIALTFGPYALVIRPTGVLVMLVRELDDEDHQQVASSRRFLLTGYIDLAAV